MSEPPARFPVRLFCLVAVALIAAGVGLWWVRSSSPPTNPDPVPSAKPAAEDPGPDKSSVAARMRGNGVMRGMIVTAQRNAIERELGGILVELKFTADQRTRFVDLLMENQSVVVEASLTRMAGVTAAQEAQLQGKIEAANADALAKSEVFFAKEFPRDPAKFAAFQHYSALAPDRIEVAALRQRLTAAKRTLIPAQERALTEVMHDLRTNVIPALDPDDPDLAGLSPKDLAQRIRDQQRIDALLRTKTATVLDPAQVAVLAAQQAERLKPFQALVDQAPKPDAPAVR